MCTVWRQKVSTCTIRHLNRCFIEPSNLLPGDRPQTLKCFTENYFLSRLNYVHSCAAIFDIIKLLISHRSWYRYVYYIKLAVYLVVLYPVYTIKQTSSWLVQLTRASSSSQLHRVNGVLLMGIRIMSHYSHRCYILGCHATEMRVAIENYPRRKDLDKWKTEAITDTKCCMLLDGRQGSLAWLL